MRINSFNINNISGCNTVDTAAGVSKQLSREVLLSRGILFFCDLKGALSMENALLRLKPIKIVEE